MTAPVEKNHRLRKDVIKHLYFSKVLTLTDLSTLTHKSLPLVTSTVNDLVNEGYVVESEEARSTGGRKAAMYLLNKEKQRYIVAVAVDQMVTRVQIYDLLNHSKMDVEQLQLPLTHDSGQMASLAGFLKDYISRSGIPAAQVLGVGVGMPGFISSKLGINYTFFNDKGNHTLVGFLNKELGLPVFIDNDSSLIALAELRFGMGKGKQEVLVVNMNWGVGLGMIINSKLFRGHTGYAGEFSHIPLSQTNKLCSCGKRGCLEVETSLSVLVERAKAELDKGVSSRLTQLFEDTTKLEGDHFLEAANAGDPLAVSILSDAAFLIGKGLATLIHIINPELIVIGGRGAVAGRILMAPIQHAINEFCIPRMAEQTTIKVSDLKNESQLLGAAILVVENCQFN